MPVSHWIDETSGILWQKFYGFIDLAEVVKFERSMRDSGLGSCDTIVDLTDLTGSDITADQMTYLATLPKRAAKLAIVAPQDSRFGRARMYEMMAESRDHSVSIRVFRTPAEAEEWLRGGAGVNAGTGAGTD